MKRKNEMIIILSSLLVIVLSVSVAYFTTKILGTEKDMTATLADLKILFTNGDGTIEGSEIVPGWSSGEKTFSVKNESDSLYKYNIIVEKLVNTFVTNGFLVYKITSADGGYNMTEFADIPKSNTASNKPLAKSISIEKGKTHTYKVEFKYLESTTVDQTEDMGKKLSGKIFIEKTTDNPTLASKLLEDNPTISERTDFSTPFITNTANTLYKSTENGVDVYYFAGQDTESTPINNWVKFGEIFYWRIIRTNSDGSVRLLYSGINHDTIRAYIEYRDGNSLYDRAVFSASVNSPKYVGYMYGDNDSDLNSIRSNTNDSTIKTYIDNWYETYLKSYSGYLSNDAIYCSDRNLKSGEVYSNLTTKSFNFQSVERLYYTNKVPKYDCTNNKDAFSGNNSEAKLKYPIALITADEIAYAGGVNKTESPMWYYSNSLYESIVGGAYWWTMTPFTWNKGAINMYGVYGAGSPGYLGGRAAKGTQAVRPVTSLKSCVQWKSGDGSAINPYEIVENGGC